MTAEIDEGIRVRIIGDGTPQGTQVIDAMTGIPIRGVQRVEYAVAVDQAPIKARITVIKAELDVLVPAEVVEARLPERIEAPQGSADAMEWAESFVTYVAHNPAIATDAGTMVGWFANAMMAQQDHYARTQDQA